MASLLVSRQAIAVPAAGGAAVRCDSRQRAAVATGEGGSTRRALSLLRAPELALRRRLELAAIAAAPRLAGSILAAPRGYRMDGWRRDPRAALSRLRRPHRHDKREEGVVLFELAPRQFLRRHADKESDGREHIPSRPDRDAVGGEDVAEQA
jgi:hypothetical protein